MKQYILFLLALPPAILYAQTDSLKPKNGERSFIPGTHISLILPQGFKYAKDFIGIEKDDKTYVQIFDPYESDYSTSSSSFTRPIFENKGMDVFTFKTMNVGSYTAKYTGMKSSTGYKKYELLFGDSTFSALLLGHCSVNDEVVSKAIEDAILSVKYDKKTKVDPYVHTFFSMNDSTSTFKFSMHDGKVFDYYMDGKIKVADNDPVFTVTPFTVEQAFSDKEVKKAMEDIYKKEGMTSIKVKNESDAKINGYDAYESEVYGKLNGRQVLIYQLTISKDGNALLIKGVTRDDFEKNLAEFKKLVHTISFKDQPK